MALHSAGFGAFILVLSLQTGLSVWHKVNKKPSFVLVNYRRESRYKLSFR